MVVELSADIINGKMDVFLCFPSSVVVVKCWRGIQT